MTPFQEFRLWARRAPSSERVFAGVAAAIVLALLAWLLVPETADDSDEFVSAGTSVTEEAVAAWTTIWETEDHSTPKGRRRTARLHLAGRWSSRHHGFRDQDRHHAGPDRRARREQPVRSGVGR